MQFFQLVTAGLYALHVHGHEKRLGGENCKVKDMIV